MDGRTHGTRYRAPVKTIVPGVLDYDRLLGPTFQMQRSIQAMQDAIMPPSVRMAFDMQRSLERFRPAEIAGISALVDMRERFDHGRLFGSMRALADVMRAQELLPRFSLPGITGSSVLHATIGSQLMPGLRLAETLERVFPPALGLEWKTHLARSIVPSLDVFTAADLRPVGLLAFMEDPTAGASLTWLSDDADRPLVAALVAEDAPLPRITVDAVVCCAFCDAELPVHDRTFRWRGNRLRIDLKTIPICTSCLKDTSDYTTHVYDALHKLTRPSLRLLRTGGTSDGIARGKLRLVVDAAEEENEAREPTE